MLDLALAVGHHLFVFALFAALVAELALVRPGLSQESLGRVAAVDLWYGVLAGAVVVLGFSRAVFAAKGWAFYSHNLFFWTKISAFLLIAVLSAVPTIAFIRWRRAGVDPAPQALEVVRRVLWTEMALFALLPVCAALMARGYGQIA